MKRAYGWRPSPPDARDKIADPSGLTILPEVDLRKGPMPLVFDQGQLGSCTAQATCAAFQYDRSLDLVTRRSRRLSRLDTYYGERALEGELGQGDVGAYGRDAFKFFQQSGVLLESAWPYTDAQSGPGDYEGPPPAGKRHKLTKPYAAVTKDKAHIQAVLSNQQLIAIGFRVYSEFESENVAEFGVVNLPDLSVESELGGHEVLLVGYLADWPHHALVRNSWGSGWGIGGYFLMEWEYVLSNLTSDLRTIVRATT